MESGRRLVLGSCWMAVGLLSICSGLLHESQRCDHEGGACSSFSRFHVDSSAAAAAHGFQQEPRDVYDSLWADNQDVARQTLKLPFLQHLGLGDLQGDDYVAFMIQDINYVQKVTDMLKVMSENVDSPEDIKEFMKSRYESYRAFTELLLEQFHLNGVSDIEAIPAMQKYLSDYQTIMEEEEPIFFAVSLLPCSRLWLWLANRLHIGYGNAYFVWKRNNMHGNPEEHYRKLLDDHLKTPEQIARANQIFRQQMQHEHDFFAASLRE